MTTTLSAYRERYERDIGLSTIPLKSGSKRPCCDNWQATPPYAQWQESSGTAGNIGIRTGNGFGGADADAPQTTANLTAYWAGLGVKPPTVATPSGGRHFWLFVDEVPPGTNYYHWHPDIGLGELRVGPGALLVAPCSMVNGKRYRFLPGTAPEDLLRMRRLRWRDLLPLIKPKQSTPLDVLPVAFPRRDLADWARWLLAALRSTPPSETVKRPQTNLNGTWRRDAAGNALVIEYASRSEAEQSVILHAVWCGWDFTEVMALFEQHQPGHYAAQHDKEGYLRRCWQHALGHLAGTPEREAIARLWRWAEDRAWPGSGGGNERLAYLALLQRAWLAGTLEPNLSRRDVELYGSMGSTGARGALQRLVRQGLIAPAGQRQRPTEARAWRLCTEVIDAQPVTVTLSTRGVDALPGGNEMWSVLGRSAGMVYPYLNAQPVSAATLAAVTGKDRSTVYRALNRLVGSGLACATEGGWVLGVRDVAEVAHEVGAHAAKNRREVAIEHERLVFREQLAEHAA